MSYSADTFVADEQPTTAKWNKLWSNDASFNDGSGLNNISNPITAATGSHLVLTPGTSKFVKLAVLRQDDTTNTYKNNSIFLTGWGVITPGVTSTASETVTFGITFDQRPIVLSAAGGDHATATTYGSGGLNIKFQYAMTNTITTTSFASYVRSTDGTNWAAGNTVFYQWIAAGELA